MPTEPGTERALNEHWRAEFSFPRQANASSSFPSFLTTLLGPGSPPEPFSSCKGRTRNPLHLLPPQCAPSERGWLACPAGPSLRPGRPRASRGMPSGLLTIELVSAHPFPPPTTAGHLLISQDFVESSLTFCYPVSQLRPHTL